MRPIDYVLASKSDNSMESNDSEANQLSIKMACHVRANVKRRKLRSQRNRIRRR